MTKELFCAKEQLITNHEGSVDSNGEFVFTCITKGCNSFLKFPASVSPKDFKVLLEKHEAANKGQVSVEIQEKKLKELMGVK